MRHGVKIVDEAQETEGVAVAANAEDVWLIMDGDGELAILLRSYFVKRTDEIESKTNVFEEFLTKHYSVIPSFDSWQFQS
ncbi:hypothetical protein J6590_100985 [Homalodisca vitripennis]|nr:hypothetical protein J6590_100985 [Homalodisca vitripennis]